MNENIANELEKSWSITLQFNISPKLHKESDPGYPMVSSINCRTTNISKYLNYHAHSILKKIPFYLKETNDFINKTNAVKSVPNNSYLVTMDVR